MHKSSSPFHIVGPDNDVQHCETVYEVTCFLIGKDLTQYTVYAQVLIRDVQLEDMENRLTEVEEAYGY